MTVRYNLTDFISYEFFLAISNMLFASSIFIFMICLKLGNGLSGITVEGRLLNMQYHQFMNEIITYNYNNNNNNTGNRLGNYTIIHYSTV